MTKKLCIITGVGPGTGTSLVKQFAQDYRVAMIARSEDRLNELAQQVPDTFSYPCDVSNAEQLKQTLSRISEEHGDVEIVVHNAVGGAFGDILDIDPAVLQQNFQINTMSLMHIVQTVGPTMVKNGTGVILATGNTSAYRGRAQFSAFAPSKAAQRILLESAARALGPKGIHCAYVAIDAVIDVPWARERFHDKPDDFFAKPDDIAHECHRIAHQPRSTWSSDVIVRPYCETW